MLGTMTVIPVRIAIALYLSLSKMMTTRLSESICCILTVKHLLYSTMILKVTMMGRIATDIEESLSTVVAAVIYASRRRQHVICRS